MRRRHRPDPAHRADHGQRRREGVELLTSNVSRVDARHAATASPTLEPLRDWFRTWEQYVRAVDFASARQLFDPDVASFGTHAEIVFGIDQLVAQQWSAIWPAITDFRFLVDRLHGEITGTYAWAAVPWTSTGYHQDGTAFDRPRPRHRHFAPRRHPLARPAHALLPQARHPAPHLRQTEAGFCASVRPGEPDRTHPQMSSSDLFSRTHRSTTPGRRCFAMPRLHHPSNSRRDGSSRPSEQVRGQASARMASVGVAPPIPTLSVILGLGPRTHFSTYPDTRLYVVRFRHHQPSGLAAPWVLATQREDDSSGWRGLPDPLCSTNTKPLAVHRTRGFASSVSVPRRGGTARAVPL